MTHCTFICRSFFTGLFAVLTKRSYWHSIANISAFTSGERDFFSQFSLLWLSGR